ncbi:MAG: hypothetical protein CMJ46_16260 [Planctomyces sp.]|nr:hypothetical protein [Planctomyces sp.]
MGCLLKHIAPAEARKSFFVEPLNLTARLFRLLRSVEQRKKTGPDCGHREFSIGNLSLLMKGDGSCNQLMFTGGNMPHIGRVFFRKHP